MACQQCFSSNDPESCQVNGCEAHTLMVHKAMPSPLPDESDYFVPIYRAMAALAPKYDPEYRAMSDQLGDTVQERDVTLACVASLENRVKELQSYTHGLAGAVDRLLGEVANRLHPNEVKALLAAKDARIAELDTMLAQYTVGATDTRAPEPNPFREFPEDRRRIGA